MLKKTGITGLEHRCRKLNTLPENEYKVRLEKRPRGQDENSGTTHVTRPGFTNSKTWKVHIVYSPQKGQESKFKGS